MRFVPPTIKPEDLVRTPTGATGSVETILPYGYRNVRLLNGELVTLKVELLYLVRPSVPVSWSERERRAEMERRRAERDAGWSFGLPELKSR